LLGGGKRSESTQLPPNAADHGGETNQRQHLPQAEGFSSAERVQEKTAAGENETRQCEAEHLLTAAMWRRAAAEHQDGTAQRHQEGKRQQDVGPVLHAATG
jgi:hypothetical protein